MLSWMFVYDIHPQSSICFYHHVHLLTPLDESERLTPKQDINMSLSKKEPRNYFLLSFKVQVGVILVNCSNE